MYEQLRLNLVHTVFTSWNDTGFAWEQYNADTGKGQRTQYFTGWTALIVKVLAMPHSPERSSAPVVAEVISEAPDLKVSGLRLYIIILAISFFLYFFRRRMVKLWRRFT